ncbi:unnamed protein product [Chironomus riparius]|uniref:Uncharacterized protein n=1 Tax=Chironomus riparius TaxID=315576 RepID=A0A9N9S7T5_9DIPT|nr:unnamed protein product [Chironomus riparius]
MKFFVKFLVYLISLKIVSACQGHKLKVNYIQNIDSDSVIKIMENSTAKLTKDCFIIPSACGRTNGFNTAMVHVEVFKNNLSIHKSDFDGCKNLEDAQPEFKEMIKMFGLPEHCPVSKVDTCEDGSKKIDLNKYKHIFNLARGGAIRTEVEIKHDNGKSTFKSEFQITKN